MAGEIKDCDLLEASKVYSFNTLNRILPENHRAADIDAVVESEGRFLFFEFKCSVSPTLKAGQRKLWESLLRVMGDRAIMVLCEHKDLSAGQPTDPLTFLDCYRVYYWDGDAVSKTTRMSPSGGSLAGLISDWFTGRKTLRNMLAAFADN